MSAECARISVAIRTDCGRVSGYIRPMTRRGRTPLRAAIGCCVVLVLSSCADRTNLDSGPPAVSVVTTVSGSTSEATSTTVVATTVAQTSTTTAATAVVAPTVVATTAVATTVAPTATAAAPETSTTVATPVDPLQIRVGGFGRFDFGTRPLDMLSLISTKLGAPTSSTPQDFPVANGAVYATPDAQLSFTRPIAQKVCWSELCVYLGGDAAASLAFVGWEYIAGAAAPPTVKLHNADGITLGSRWAAFGSAMSVQPGGCASATAGRGSTSDSTHLFVQGANFKVPNAAGGFDPATPDPSVVTVSGMFAGDRFVKASGDC